MCHLWSFFQNANEMAYVSDLDTYEILHMNHKALKAYDISSINVLEGRKCYEVFYGNSAPCAMCCSGQLREGKFLKRKHFNPLLNRHFLLMDTIFQEDGHRCRFELAIDINEYEATRQQFDQHEAMEARINEGIRYAICEPDPNRSLLILLEFLGKMLHSDRAYIFEKNALHGDDNTYEWTAVGVTPQKDNLQNLPSKICENWYRCFSKNESIMFDDIETMRYTDPLQYENLKCQAIHSIVVVPLYDGHRVIGFYGIDNPPEQELGYTRNMLQIVGYFISSMLKRRDVMNQLFEMSMTDQLTKLGNRHAMDEYITSIETGRSLGVVYCDVTGLKKVNDTMGHKMGDELICRAAGSLKRAMGDHGLFRIGGDELLALCMDIEEDALRNHIEILREKAAQSSVNLAIGAIWTASYEGNLQKLMSEAERWMYKEKSEYYQKSGIDRRR